MSYFPRGVLAGATKGGRRVASTRWSGHATRLTAMVAAMLTATACTSVVDGTAQRPAGGPPPGVVDVTLLDTGNYPTRPAPPLGVAGSRPKGALAEAVRMAEHVIGPWETDPALERWVMPTSIFKDAASLRMLLPVRIAAAADKHDFVTGFSSGRRTDPPGTSLVNAVLRFADPAAAAAAATEFADLALQPDIADYLPPAQPVSVPNHPDARASTYETVPPGSTTPETAVNAYSARGPFVLIQSADTPRGVGPTADLVAKALDRQIPAIDAFKPTPVAELPNLALDESGLLARTIPETGDKIPVETNHVYGSYAALHFQTSPQSSAELFADTGMDLWSRGKTSVYRVRDEEAAAKMVEQFAAESDASGGPVAPVPNMPDSRCSQHDDRLGSYVGCFAVADRYVIEANSAQVNDAHQMAAAQYTMLMAS